MADVTIVRADSLHPDFVSLVQLLDADLALRDGSDHTFYSQFNKIDKIKHAVVAYSSGKPAGCGAIRAFSDEAMEVKRMYVVPSGRNTGIASQVLAELERWAAELGYTTCILETGRRQPEAIALYRKHGYEPMPNYGQYAGVENSLCFRKQLNLRV